MSKWNPATPPVAAYMNDADPAFDEAAMRQKVERFYSVVDPSRPAEARENVIQLIRKEGLDAINARMIAKYGRDLNSVGEPQAAASQVASRAAPVPEPAMTTTLVVAPYSEVAAGLGFKQYSVDFGNLRALCTCGAFDVCIVTEVATNSKVRFGFGCLELPCYQDDKHIGRLTLDYSGDGTWIKVPTLKGVGGNVLARCYLARNANDCCATNVFYLLDIVGYQVLKAPMPSCYTGELTFYDQTNQVAIELREGPCVCYPEIRARSDIPHYAVALVPMRNSNQRNG